MNQPQVSYSGLTTFCTEIKYDENENNQLNWKKQLGWVESSICTCQLSVLSIICFNSYTSLRLNRFFSFSKNKTKCNNQYNTYHSLPHWVLLSERHEAICIYRSFFTPCFPYKGKRWKRYEYLDEVEKKMNRWIFF